MANIGSKWTRFMAVGCSHGKHIESHSSEEQVICFDRILMNNDSVAKLHDDLETFLSIIP